MKDSQVTAAPVTMDINGTEFRASPLTDKDHSELDLWCQGRLIKMTRASLNGESDEEYEKAMRIATRQASSIKWMMDEGRELINSRDGIAKLAWQMVHRNHPNVTIEELNKLIEYPTYADSVVDAYTQLHLDPEEKEEYSESVGNGKKSRQRKKKSTER